MAISFIGQANGVASATLPAHQAGDLIVAFAFRDGSTTQPTMPSGGWTDISSSAGANTCCSRVSYLRAITSETVSGTWTNATSVVFLVYRGVHQVTPIGGNGLSQASSNTITYPTLTMVDASGTSWVAGFAGHRSTNTALETAPSGMTNRSTVNDATDEAAGHDTNGGVTAWANTNVSAGGTASGYSARTVELRAAPSWTFSANKLTNGDFAGNVTTGWSPTDAASLSAPSGELLVNSGTTITGPPSGRQQIDSLTIGDIVCLDWDFRGVSAARATVLAYSNPTFNLYVDVETVTGTAVHGEVWFTLLEDSAIVFAAVRTASAQAIFDNIRFRVATVASNGTAAQTVPDATQSATGDTDVAGTAAQAVPDLTNAASGAVVVTGAAAQTVDVITQSASGAAKVAGTTTQADTFLQTASGGTPVVGIATQVEDIGAQTASGTVLLGGIAVQTIADPTQSAIGDVDVAGSASDNLQITQDASGNVPEVGVAVGIATQTLADLPQNALGLTTVAGSTTQTIIALAETGSGAPVVEGVTSQLVDELVSEAGGLVVFTAVADQSLAFVSDALGGVLVLGTLAHTIDVIQDGIGHSSTGPSPEPRTITGEADRASITTHGFRASLVGTSRRYRFVV